MAEKTAEEEVVEEVVEGVLEAALDTLHLLWTTDDDGLL